MKGAKKKSKDEDYDKCIEELAELIVKEVHQEPHPELEPFEIYAARIKAKVHANMDEFRSRFAKGYHVLLEEIEKSSKNTKGP